MRSTLKSKVRGGNSSPRLKTDGFSRRKIYKNIILIGPMGAGKTTIGRLLAEELNARFYDSDAVIEKKTGVDIPLIFHLEGEKGFRKRERKVIEVLLKYQNIVLATGGGAILLQQNRDLFQAPEHIVIYLYASHEQLFLRISKDQHRPLLQTEHPQQTLREILKYRHPLYVEVASITIKTGNQPAKVVVKEILKELELSK